MPPRTAKKTGKKTTRASKKVKRPAARPRESRVKRVARAERVLAALQASYPESSTALHHRSAYELLVATILSAQCTDERVNQVTPSLFRRYPDAHALAAADAGDVEAAIHSTGFYRNKTKSLLGMARAVCDEHAGEIPDNMDDLLKLPGVARKTANCVLGSWFEQNVGVVVDTHVGRIAERLAFTPSARDSKDAVKIEQDLMDVFPQHAWTFLSHALILHGRQVCTARKPKCDACPLAPECPSAGRV